MKQFKGTPTASLLEQNVHCLIHFYYEVAQIKQLYRSGWLNEKRGIPKGECESVGDHSFGVALLSYVVAEEYRQDLDLSKVLRLALIHDLPEARNGDYTPGEISEQQKLCNENSAMQGIFSKFPDPTKYLQLWNEYTNQSSSEAKFVKQMDKLEVVLQASVYEKQGYSGVADFFPWAQEILHEPAAREVLEEIISLRQID